MPRALDVILACLLGVVALPLLAAAGVVILVTMGWPVLFRQSRAGRGGQPFLLYKLRTMAETRDEQGRLLRDDLRLTRLGRFLRATSLDELPQLWNVLRGDMSLVGPRALLLAYVSRYSAQQRRRLEVKPGITGWAQIHGRNMLTWEQKFALDLWYVDHRSLLLDLKILALTFRQVVRPNGISQAGHATMPEFLGTAVMAADSKGPE